MEVRTFRANRTRLSRAGLDISSYRRQGKIEATTSGPVRLASVLAVSLALAGCTMVGPDFEQPETEVNQDWIESDSPQLRQDKVPEYGAWWRSLNDPVLDRLVQTAYRQNLTLQAAGVRVLQARAQLGIAVGNLYPQQQQARAGIAYTSISDAIANSPDDIDRNFWTYDFGFDAAWEADIWGRFRRGIESADAQLLASIASYDDVLVTLTAEVANAYVVMRTLEERVRIAQENVEIQRRSLEIATVRFRNGATTELDVTQATTLLKNTEATVPTLQIGVRQARYAISTLLGMPPSTLDAMLGEGAIPSAPPEVAIGVPAELLRRRPDVRTAELQAAAQSANIGIATADLYPAFSLFGSIGFQAGDGTNSAGRGGTGFSKLFTGGAFTVQAGPSMQWNIFNYGRIKNNVRAQDAAFQQLIANYQNTVLEAAGEAESAMVGFLKSQEAVIFLADSVKAARRSVELSLVQYRDGAVDYQRVLDSQNSLVDQQDRLANSQGEVPRNLVAMYKALGGGWEIRAGQDLVPEPVRQQMAERTDWGQLLNPEEVENIESPAEAARNRRQIDW